MHIMHAWLFILYTQVMEFYTFKHCMINIKYLRNSTNEDVDIYRHRVYVTPLIEYMAWLLSYSISVLSPNSQFLREKCKLYQLPQCAGPYTIIHSSCPSTVTILNGMLIETCCNKLRSLDYTGGLLNPSPNPYSPKCVYLVSQVYPWNGTFNNKTLNHACWPRLSTSSYACTTSKQKLI